MNRGCVILDIDGQGRGDISKAKAAGPGISYEGIVIGKKPEKAAPQVAKAPKS